MNNQSAHGIKGLRTFPTQAANVISSVPVCSDDDCMQCAMGLHCPNVPKATAKPRVRVCLSWTARQLEVAMFEVVLAARADAGRAAKVANLAAMGISAGIIARAHAATSKEFADNAERIWRNHNPRPQGNSATTRKRQAVYDRKAPAAIAAVRAEALS